MMGSVKPKVSCSSRLMLPLLARYWANIARHVEPKHRSGRLKQWLNFLRRRFPEAQVAYDSLKTVNDAARIEDWLRSQQAQRAPPGQSVRCIGPATRSAPHKPDAALRRDWVGA